MKLNNKKQKQGPIVIELNLSLTVGIVGAIIAIIVAITTIKVITTMLQAKESKNLGNESEINQYAVYVTSTTKDDNGNIVEDKDSNGNVIKVPVPKGYTASKIDGETSANKGFVIYEGDVDWSTILVNSQNTKSTGTQSTNSTKSIITQSTTGNTQSKNTQETTMSTESTNTIEIQSTNSTKSTNTESTTENTKSPNTQKTTVNTENNKTQSTNTSSTESIDKLKTEKSSNTTNTHISESTSSTKNEKENKITETTKREESNNVTEATQQNVTSSTTSSTKSTKKEEIIEENKVTTSTEETTNEENTTENEETVSTVEIEADTTADDTSVTDSTELTLEEQQVKNIFDLQKERNQYVWVPVNDPSRIYGVDSNGKVWGKLYVMYKSSFNNSEWYYGMTKENWTETNGIMSIIDAKDWREPDVISNNQYYDIDSKVLGETKYEMLAQELEQNYLEIIESIKKYGGFYIGRYETGGLSSIAVINKMNTDIGNQNWYTMYKKCLTLKGSNNNIKTMMITGSLWDETVNWLVSSGATNLEGTVLTYKLVWDSTTFGNYRDATFNYIAKDAEIPTATETKAIGTSALIPTGSTEYAKINNIYDMAGNVLEWTTATYSDFCRVIRGGYYDNYMYSSSMASRIGRNANSSDNDVRLPCNTLY